MQPISQDSYDSILASLQFHRLTCTCGHSGCLSIHRYYSRKLKQGSHSISLAICSVKCTLCSRTHALLPALIVPYSQISLPDQTDIILAAERGASAESVMERSPSIDENNVSCVLSRYRKHWRQRLLSEGIPLLPLM